LKKLEYSNISKFIKSKKKKILAPHSAQKSLPSCQNKNYRRFLEKVDTLVSRKKILKTKIFRHLGQNFRPFKKGRLRGSSGAFDFDQSENHPIF